MEIQLWKRIAALVLLVLVACLSFFLIGRGASDPETYSSTITSIDDKVETVLKLTATSTIASAGISALPGDICTPISEKLADFSEYFLLILCVLYAEKYLLTIIGTGAFRILIPAACAFFGIGLFWNPKMMGKLGLKFALFALALYFVIPASIKVSDIIYDTYQVSINTTIEMAEQLAEDTEELAEAQEEEDEGVLAGLWNRITETTDNLTEQAAETLNRFVETLAVMIVTSCIIPLLVLFFFLWIIRMVTGIEINVPVPGRRRRGAPIQNPLN